MVTSIPVSLNKFSENTNLFQSHGGGTASTTYLYDHTGQRTSKTSNSITTHYPSALYEAQGATTTKLGDQVVATIQSDTPGPKTFHNHLDHLGSTQVVSTPDGYLNQEMAYYPFGSPRITNQYGELNQKNRYIGQGYDEESSLSYLNARYYDSTRGQFTSQDPVFWEVGTSKEGLIAIHDPQIQNIYNYSRNNPVRFTDPSGRWYKEFFWDNIRTLGNGQSWESFTGELNDAAYQLSRQSAVWNYAMDHPYVGGSVVGIGAGVVLYGGSAAMVHGQRTLTVGQKALQYRDSLLQNVSNPKLSNIIKNTYKASDTIEGGTFGALRNELTTGTLTKGVSHLQKTQDTLNGISNVLKSGKVTEGDLKAISKLLNNLAKELKKIKTR